MSQEPYLFIVPFSAGREPLIRVKSPWSQGPLPGRAEAVVVHPHLQDSESAHRVTGEAGVR